MESGNLELEDMAGWGGGGAGIWDPFNGDGGGVLGGDYSGDSYYPASFNPFTDNPFLQIPTGGGSNGPFGGAPGSGISINIGGGGGVGGPKPPDTSETLTAIVNRIEGLLQVNLGQWQMSALSADDAISNAWDLMNRMVSECLRFGAEGQKAAAERDRRIAPSMLRWDWIAYYIDPITGGGTALAPLPGAAVVVGTNPNGTPIYGAGVGSNVSAFRFDPVIIGIGLLLIYLAVRKS